MHYGVYLYKISDNKRSINTIMIKASVIGATGYAGAELVRMLLSHPEVKIKYLASKSYEGQKLSAVYPNIQTTDIELCGLDIEKIATASDVVFCALPHGVSAKTSSALLEYGTRVIDLSGDLRYDDEKVYEKWYGVEHTNPDVMKKAVLGLSEIYNEKISSASIVANPGCYTTCSILALYPLLAEGVIESKGIIIDAKSGATGAGRGAKTNLLFCEIDENLKAYGLTNHRHTSEIEQELSKAAGEEIILSFTPHLVPMKRGILSTIYTDLKSGAGDEDIKASYKKYYGDSPFINFTGYNIPETKHVVGSNRLDIGFKTDPRLNKAIIVSALDNIVKGAGGQAIQNMNVMFGLDEEAGLCINGLYL
jgi:N-acetyl-gamma-glutamyl-phosphate reductase